MRLSSDKTSVSLDVRSASSGWFSNSCLCNSCSTDACIPSRRSLASLVMARPAGKQHAALKWHLNMIPVVITDVNTRKSGWKRKIRVLTWAQKANCLQQNLLHHVHVVWLKSAAHSQALAAKLLVRDLLDEVYVDDNPRVLIVVQTLTNINRIVQGKDQLLSLWSWK